MVGGVQVSSTDGLFDLAGSAAYLGISFKELQQLFVQGFLPSPYRCAGRQYYSPRQLDLAASLYEGHHRPARPEAPAVVPGPSEALSEAELKKAYNYYASLGKRDRGAAPTDKQLWDTAEAYLTGRRRRLGIPLPWEGGPPFEIVPRPEGAL